MIILASSIVELTFAFTAGVLSLLSPCSFPLLPGYMVYMLGTKGSTIRAIIGGVAFTLGLISTLSILGIVVSTLGGFVLEYIPLFQFVVALIIVAFGIVMILGMNLPPLLRGVPSVNRRSLIGMYSFGLAYGVAMSGCAAPIFFSILLYTATQEMVQGVATFTAYALGMGMIFIIVGIFAAEARDILIRKMVRITPLMNRLSGLGLLGAGIYMFFTYF